MNKLKNTSLILLTIFFCDYVLSNLFFKKMKFWEYEKLIDYYWRISSDVYHHDLLANTDVIEPWGFSMKKRLITNSLGFRDFSKKEVTKIPEKKRILLIGDSAIEGAGYDYEHTIGGLLQRNFAKTHEILNSAVGSYSPSIYLKKVEYFLNQGYKFNSAILFLDPSDIIDELFIKKDSLGNILVDKKDLEEKRIENFLLDNFLIIRTFLRISDATENLKNFFKLKYKASKKFEKSFFDTTNEDTMFYRMTHVDRSAWTFDNTLFQNYKEGLKKSDENLTNLVNILKENNIKIYFVLYPHPSQIVYKDLYHFPYWKEWAKKNDINFIELYSDFESEKKKEMALSTFIFGDLHWNKKGTKKVFNSLISKIDF